MIIEYVGEKKKKEDVCFPIWKRQVGQQCDQYYGRNGNHGDSESFGWIVKL